MKRLLTILLVLISYLGVSQSPVNRSGASNTVVDQRWMGALNMFVPVFPDTATASISKGIDSVGFIYTRDVDKPWYRALQPYRHWVLIGTGSGVPTLPDGVYSGGNVAWSGIGLIFNVSPASYVLNGVARTYPGGTVTLPPADPTFGTIDYIILDSTGANFVPGLPSANPQAPSLNPQTQLGRAFVTIPANSTVPLITTSSVFDENLGQPSEWDATSNGTVVFGNTNFPYHLTIAFAATGFVNGQYILFNNNNNYNSSQQGSLVGFFRLGGAMGLNQNININLIDSNGNIVGATLNATGYGLNRNLFNAYQPIIIPMPDFGAANLLFKGIQFTASGAGTFPQFNGDFIQFQTGFTQISTQQNAFTSVTADGGGLLQATTPTSTIPITGTHAILTSVNSSNQIEFSGIELIRNDTYFASTQPLSAVNVDKYVQVINSGVLSGALTIHGGQSGLAALVDFQSANTNCCAFNGYSYYNVQQILSPAAVSGSLITLRIGRRNNAYFESGFLAYMYDGATVNTSHIGIGFVDPTDSPMPFAFGADSTFKILMPVLNGDNTFKLDVGAKSRFLDAVQSGYLTAGARITDSTFIWKAALDSLVAAKIISNGVTSVATNALTGITGGPITTTGTISADTTLLATRLYVNNRVASAGTFYNTNLGAFFRWAVPNTNGIKGARGINGILLDSATSNTNTFQVDSSIYATKAFVASVAGGGGFTGVTSVSVVNANGFFGSVATSTTTPAITITTTITGLLKGNATAISAAAGSDINTAFGSQTANFVYASPNGSAGNPTFRALVAADVPTLNQNTTGTAATITGIATVPHGGTGLSTLTAFGLMAAGTTSTGNMQQIGVGTAGQVLVSNGAGALPTFQAISVTAGVSSLTGTANRVTVSAATGAITITGPQDIATTSSPTFRSLTLGGTAATTPLTFVTNTDATAAAGRWYYNTTRLGFSLAATILRVPLTNDVTPANGQIPIGNGTNYTVANITAGDNGTLITNGAGTIAIKNNSTPQTLTSGATITWNVANGENANLTLANTGATLNLTNPVAGHTYVIQITQGTGGSRTITTWPAGTIWPSGTAPVLGTAVGARNLISLYYNGTSFFGAFNPNIYQ